MVSFSPDLTRFANLFSQPGGRSSQALSKVDVQSQTQTGLSIVTAEGDKVTLSTNASFQGTGVKYNARGVAEGQAISLRSNVLEGAFSSQKQIRIEGDLNEQEVKDIKKIVNQVNGLRQDVVTGDLKAVLANGQQFAASGSIASVNLKIQHAESVSVQQTSVRQKIQQSSNTSGAIANHGHGAPRSGSSALDFLKGLFESLGRTALVGEEPGSTKSSSPSQTVSLNPVIEKVPTSSSQELPNNAGHVDSTLNEFLNNVGEKILNGARKISRLANRLAGKVERQAGKIAKTMERITDAITNGKEGKAERLQQKLDRRIGRLEHITERIGNRIERATNKLTRLIDSLTDRLAPSQDPFSETPPVSQGVSREVPSVEKPQPEQKPAGEALAV